MNSTDLVKLAYSVSSKWLSESLPRRWAHVRGVADRALSVAPLFNVSDQKLLVAAAVLHDIGYAPGLSDTEFHPLDGARYLRKGGFPSRLCALVAHHSCAYREAELRGLSAELAEWVDEETALRDALWWADMTTTPDGRLTNLNDRIEEIQARYGPEDLVTFFIHQARSDLMDAVNRTEERLYNAGLDYLLK